MFALFWLQSFQQLQISLRNAQGTPSDSERQSEWQDTNQKPCGLCLWPLKDIVLLASHRRGNASHWEVKDTSWHCVRTLTASGNRDRPRKEDKETACSARASLARRRQSKLCFWLFAQQSWCPEEKNCWWYSVTNVAGGNSAILWRGEHTSTGMVLWDITPNWVCHCVSERDCGWDEHVKADSECWRSAGTLRTLCERCQFMSVLSHSFLFVSKGHNQHDKDTRPKEKCFFRVWLVQAIPMSPQVEVNELLPKFSGWPQPKDQTWGWRTIGPLPEISRLRQSPVHYTASLPRTCLQVWKCVLIRPPPTTPPPANKYV